MTQFDPVKEDEKEVGGWLRMIVFIAIGVALFRILAGYHINNTALLYVGIPFGMSLALYFFTPRLKGTTWKRRFWNNVRTTMIIMLASSVILMEGYVCVLMFLPIYFFFTFVAFVAAYIHHRSDRKSLHAYALPVLVLAMSMEGVTDETSFPRYNEVVYSGVFEGDVATLKAAISQPIVLEGERHWLLHVFPKPVHIETVGLEQGQIRRYEFVYHRWLTERTNTHRGTFDVTFKEVGPRKIVTTIHDTSYMSHYMTFHGSELDFEPVSPTRTRVTMKVSFDRILDPMWYFEPLERFAVKKSAEYFLHQIFNHKKGGTPDV